MKFELDCIPSPQARARHAVRGKHAMAYKSAQQQRNEVELDALMRKFKPVMPLAGSIAVFMTICLPIPKSTPKKRFESLKTELIPHTKKPDLDNYLKNILDCMTRAQFWRDDSQVSMIQASKVYSERPRWVIEVKEFNVLGNW